MRASSVLACRIIVIIMTQSGLAFGQSALRGALPGSGNGANNITKAESQVGAPCPCKHGQGEYIPYSVPIDPSACNCRSCDPGYQLVDTHCERASAQTSVESKLSEGEYIFNSPPVQGLRSAISNSTGKAPLVAKANISASGDDVESAGGKTCCKHQNDNTKCHIGYHIGGEGIKLCKDKAAGAGCAIHGFNEHCCPASDVGIAWFLGGCH